jgi:hypothetical protein
MPKTYPRIQLDQSVLYRIIIQGRLDESWSFSFNQMTIITTEQKTGLSITTLQGQVTDQANLHGLLNQIRDLGLPLLSVELIEPYQ